MDIQSLFMQTFEKGVDSQTREQLGENVDGKKNWQEIEKNVEHIQLPKMEYNHEILDVLYDEMDKIDKKYVMSQNEYNPKSNHFFLQLKNLVVSKSNFIVKVNRVLQLAFNAGQLSVFVAKKMVEKDVIDLVKKYNMFDIHTYLSETNIKEINKILGQKGGGDLYYEKYLKYKYKYLNLKQI